MSHSTDSTNQFIKDSLPTTLKFQALTQLMCVAPEPSKDFIRERQEYYDNNFLSKSDLEIIVEFKRKWVAAHYNEIVDLTR